MNSTLCVIATIAISVSLSGLAFGWVYLYVLKPNDKSN